MSCAAIELLIISHRERFSAKTYNVKRHEIEINIQCVVKKLKLVMKIKLNYAGN